MTKLYIILFASLLAHSESYAQNIFPSTGNVGVGTTIPQSKLHVYNGKLVVEQSNFGANDFASLFLQTDDSFGIRTKTGIMATGNGSWGVSDLNFVVNGNNDNSSASVTDTRLIIKSTGNVGIGTLTPDSKLAVRGTVHAQEVKVDMNGWADYVFKPNYKLPSLASIKTYIDKNQHLPDMPSEAEAIKEGVKLGEMNKLLLKKVEELTLYVIQQQQEHRSLKRLLIRQQYQINNLKKVR